MSGPYKLLDLFSGIGGFSLGLERTGGFQTVAFCEIEPYCRAVLKKHWPDIPCYDDIRTLTADALLRDGIAVDAICGGFPCQDISRASARPRAGINGDRSGLWSEMLRLIGEIRPRLVVVENSSDLLSHDGGSSARTLFGDMASIGLDAEWHVIPASAVDAPHERERVWIIAYPNSHSKHVRSIDAEMAPASQPISHAHSIAPIGSAISRQKRLSWPCEPDIPRVAYGISNQSHRRHALGNAVVPQIPQIIGEAILASEASR